MNNVSLAEKAETYRIGFLSTRTSMLLERYKTNQKIEPQDENTLAGAINLIDDILKGHDTLVSRKVGMTPDVQKFRLFNYFLNDLKVFDVLKMIAEPEGGTFSPEVFKEIRLALENIHQSKTPGKNNLKNAKAFFQILSELLLKEVQEYYRPPSTLPVRRKRNE